MAPPEKMTVDLLMGESIARLILNLKEQGPVQIATMEIIAAVFANC
jgi:hypothetical protein